MNLTSGLPVFFDHLGIDLVRPQQLDALAPDLHRLAHRNPDIGVNEVDALDAFVDVCQSA